MSKTIRYWCDSGANAFSCKKGTVTTDQLGLTDEEWDALDDDAKDEIMQPLAFEQLDWGYSDE